MQCHRQSSKEFCARFINDILIICMQEEQEEVLCNVLVQHLKKNQSNRPPNLARLSTAASCQANMCGQGDEDNLQDSDDEDQNQARAAHHSKSTGEVKADMMSYYRNTPWWAILMQAKIKFHRHIALHHGFPNCDEHLSEACDVLLEAIEEFQTENDIADQGKLFLFIFSCTHYSVKTSIQYVTWTVL